VKPQLNHTIVAAHDKDESAAFLAEILGLDPPVDTGYFTEVETGNGVSIDFANADEVHSMHLAFLVTEAQFDEILDRIRAKGIATWADPMRSRPGEINTEDGGRGVYFPDPSGNFFEILTRPYGSGPRNP